MKSNSNRCVTFDLWETLIFDDPRNDETRGRRRYEGLQSVLADHGVNLESENLRRAYEESASKLQAVWNRNEEVPIIEQIQLIVELASGGATTLEVLSSSCRLMSFFLLVKFRRLTEMCRSEIERDSKEAKHGS